MNMSNFAICGNVIRHIAHIVLYLFITTTSVTAQTVEFVFEDHPPFTFSENGIVKGIFVDSTHQAAAAAGLKIVWTERSFNRINRDLDEGVTPICITGASNSSNPQKFYVSSPIGHFGQTGFLVREEHREQLEMLKNTSSLFATGLRGGFVKGGHYAIPYDEYVKQSDTTHLVLSTTHEQIVQLIARGRVDFTIENELMFPVNQRQVNRAGNNLAFVVLPDAPKVRTAHIVCTRTVPEDVLARLEASIQKIDFQQNSVN